MGVLDDILGTNTTSSQDAATAAAQSNLSATGATNNNVLSGSANRGNAAIISGAAGATDAINNGYAAGTGALSSYGQQAQDLLAKGAGTAVGTITGSNVNYQPYATSGTGANTLLSNALGVNGAEGNAAAQSAFTASPGYQYQVNQATDAAARKAASLGLAASGNTLNAITTLGSNLANQDYSSWLSNLSGLGSQGLTAAAGISGNNTAAGNIQYNAGSTGAQLLQNTGSGIAGLDASKANALSGINTGTGSGLSSNDVGLGTNIASNNLGVATDLSNLGTSDAQAQDAATNANSGILNKALGTVLSPLTGALSSSIGGFLTPAAAKASGSASASVSKNGL